MVRNVVLALLALALVVGVVLLSLRPEEAETPGGESPVAETPVGRQPVGAVPPAQQQPGVVYDDNGVAIGGVEPRPSGTPLDIDNIIASKDAHRFLSNDSRDTFTVPSPSDPEWADYLEFRRAFPSMNDNTPGYAIAYDPEWRSVLRGYRDVPDPGMELFGGEETLRGLVERVLEGLEHRHDLGSPDLVLTKEEFEIICWPSFPHSRPYTSSLWEDAWRFHFANLAAGVREARLQADQRPLDLESIAYDEIEDFQHFKLYNGVSVRAKDRETGEVLEFDWLDSVIERDGVFKVFLYKN